MTTNDELLAALLQERAGRRRRFSLSGCIVWIAAGIMFLVFMAALLPNIIASYSSLLPASIGRLISTPQITFQTRQETQGGAGSGRQPTITPGLTPFYGAPGEQDQGATAEATATTTMAPTATPTAFWNPTEIAAFTATAEAWYDPSTLPTAPPAFVQYTEDACADSERVGESRTLQLFCRK